MVWVQLAAELSAACVFLGTLIATGSAGETEKECGL